MLKRYKNLFLRKIIAAFLFIIGLTAADISGQPDMTAKPQPIVKIIVSA